MSPNPWSDAFYGLPADIAHRLSERGDSLLRDIAFEDWHEARPQYRHLTEQLDLLENEIKCRSPGLTWDISECLRSKNPIISDTVVAALAHTERDFNYIKDAYEGMAPSYPRRDNAVSRILASEYQQWSTLVYPFGFNSSFWSRVNWGGGVGSIFRDVDYLWESAPVDFMVTLWHSLMQTTKALCCQDMMDDVLVILDEDKTSQATLVYSAMVCGLAESGESIPPKHDRFWARHCQLYLKGKLETRPLNCMLRPNSTALITQSEIQCICNPQVSEAEMQDRETAPEIDSIATTIVDQPQTPGLPRPSPRETDSIGITIGYGEEIECDGDCELEYDEKLTPSTTPEASEVE
ncbi:uncharacterized protein BJX67DRAFT_386461 [Aspergillus lucknowensis]|uniref:Uncharacterized protein n=1 Tax=Aspergillus lucknowensis TaxID=176173 RepID=A0ABR4L649_9EURO